MSADLRHQLQAALGPDYLVQRELGGGGMSRVFLAEDRRLGRQVVVKVLSPDLAASVSAERFEREIRFAARLQDPHIVPLLTAGNAAGLSFYTMPFVEGESLRARLARGPVPLSEALAILRDVALALDYAHARQVAHRDVKPENVLLTRRTAVVTDFGIAKAIAAATEGATSHTMTAVGSVVGTPAYMAPEQAVGDPVDHRTDIYAWGIIAYELLAGAHPFASHATAQAVMAAHLAERPAPLSQRAPAVPAALVDLVERSLAKDRDQRPGSAAELLRVLDSLPPASLGLAPRAWPLGWRAAAIALGLGAAGAAGWLILGHGRPSRSGGPGPRSLAVLPFTSPDRDTANAYFGAGMAEELTTAFAHIQGIRVASRGSASRFLDAGASDAEIARQLGVESLLEGTVLRTGDRVRVTARLVDPRDETVLWADQYDDRLVQVFDVQDRIAHAIVAALEPRFTDTAQLANGPAARGTRDLEAYDLYLKGRYYWSRRGETGLRSSIGFFERALARDSTFARAWAGLSMAQVVLPFFSRLSPDSLLALASRNAQHALRLDSTLADGHLAWGYALKGQWRWQESERQFRQALARAPDDATIHHWYGVLLYVTGRPDDGVGQLRLAKLLDPLSTAIGTDLSYGLYLARRYDEALTEGRRVWALDTTRSDGSLQIGMIQLARGRPDSALVAFRVAERLGTGFDMPAFLSVADRRLGRIPQADSLYAEVLDHYRTDRSLAYAAAIAAAAASDLPRGIHAVAQTIDGHGLFATEISLPCDPLFDPLKHHPRFAQLLHGVGMRMCPPPPPP